MNKKTKKVKYLLPSEEIDMGGFPVKQALPTQKIQQLDPFLLLHHAHAKFNGNRLAKQQGIGPHPHRGFSPVTFVIEGEVHHRDSWNNNQIATAGEVQWLNTGAGIIHSERPSQALVEGSRKQEIIQLWINSPAKSKMLPPEYFYISNEAVTTFTSEDGAIENKLIAGSYDASEGNIKGKSELLVIWGRALKDGTQKIHIPKGFNSMLYVVKGGMRLKEYGLLEAEHLAIFETEGDHIEMTLRKDSQYIVLGGMPIGEEVTQSGPYVMNTQTEILEAMRDYQMGKMGVLIEDELI